jgi:hypothetical protein
MTWIENGISYGQAAFLQERAVELLDEAKKD